MTTNPWLGKNSGFARGYDVYLRQLFLAGVELNALVLEQLDELDRADPRDDRPLYLYVHYMDAHAPYDPAAEFFDEPELTVEIEGEPVAGDELEQRYRQMELGTPAVRDHVHARYRAAVAEVDAAIGALRAALEERGLLENSIVVLTSDHGEAFGEHGTPVHGRNYYPEVYQIPLVIRAPGRLPQARGRAAARLIGVAPSILELAEIPIPDEFEGRSLVWARPDTPIDSPPAIGAVGLNDYVPDRDYLAVVTEDYLYVHEQTTGTRELFDLRRDPGAQHKLGIPHPASDELARLLLATDGGRIPQAPEVAVPPLLRSQLEQLGYFESSSEK